MATRNNNAIGRRPRVHVQSSVATRAILVNSARSQSEDGQQIGPCALPDAERSSPPGRAPLALHVLDQGHPSRGKWEDVLWLTLQTMATTRASAFGSWGESGVGCWQDDDEPPRQQQEERATRGPFHLSKFFWALTSNGWRDPRIKCPVIRDDWRGNLQVMYVWEEHGWISEYHGDDWGPQDVRWEYILSEWHPSGCLPIWDDEGKGCRGMSWGQEDGMVPGGQEMGPCYFSLVSPTGSN